MDATFIAEIKQILGREGIEVLTDVFRSSIGTPPGVLAVRYRADHPTWMSILDRLQNEQQFLRREPDKQQTYQVRVYALPIVEDERAQILIKLLNQIYGYFKKLYPIRLTEPTTGDEIVKTIRDQDVTIHESLIKEALYYITDAHSVWSGVSTGFPYAEKNEIRINESVLLKEDFDAVLEEAYGWHLTRLERESPGQKRPSILTSHLEKQVREAQKRSGRRSVLQRKDGDRSDTAVYETLFRRYEIKGRIGVGGSGVVYRAKDDSNQEWAIKVLAAATKLDERRKRFRNELLFCSRQLHPNVLRVHDWGINSAGTPFFVTALYSSTLRRAMDRGVTPELAVQIFSKVLDGVEAAHFQDVTHRDLKPENVLCSDDLKEVVIADFGIALFKQEELYTAAETKAADRLANFKYAAPEQKNRGANVDQRADIFALGLMLNEFFTKEIVQGAGFKTIGEVAPQFAYLDTVVERMVQQNIEARQKSIGEVKKALQRAGAEFISLQRVSDLQNRVIPTESIESHHFIEPIAIKSVDWRNGSLLINLTYNPEPGWTNTFNSIGNFSAVMGKGPAVWRFQGDLASIGADENQVQQLIDHFKVYLRSADHNYRAMLEHIAQQGRAAAELKLEKERAEEEARLRILRSIKF